MSKPRLFAAVLALSTLAGCGPQFDHLDFAPHTTPPLSVSLLSTGITLPEGIAVAVTPIAMAGGERMDDVRVELISSDGSVLGVDRAEEGEGDYVIYGIRAGSTRVSIFIDGSAEGTLPATVTPQ